MRSRFLSSNYFIICGIGLLIAGCSESSRYGFVVENPNNFNVEHTAVSISLSEFPEASIPDYFQLLDQNGNKIPYQLDDLDQDGKPDILFLQLSLKANSSSSLSFKKVNEPPSFDSKTDAVFKIRDEADPESMQIGEDFRSVDSFTEQEDLQQDNGIIFLEGPGWESNLIGYRFYFDDRNRFDIFGKSSYDPALANITEEYHSRRDWGADVLKVSSTLGIGTPALFKDGTFHAIEKTGLKTLEIIADGPLRSIIKVSYPDWEVDGSSMDAELELEIHANHRYTEVRLTTSGSNDNFATGLVMHPNIENIVVNQSPEDSYMSGYTWGKQTDLDEELGMAVIIPGSLNPAYEGEIEDTYTFSMTSKDSSIRYLLMAAWEFEPESTNLVDETGFENYMNQAANQWTSPLVVTIQK